MQLLFHVKKWSGQTIFSCLNLVLVDQIWLPKLVQPSQKWSGLENQQNSCQPLAADTVCDMKLHSINDSLTWLSQTVDCYSIASLVPHANSANFVFWLGMRFSNINCAMHGHVAASNGGQLIQPYSQPFQLQPNLKFHPFYNP